MLVSVLLSTVVSYLIIRNVFYDNIFDDIFNKIERKYIYSVSSVEAQSVTITLPADYLPVEMSYIPPNYFLKSLQFIGVDLVITVLFYRFLDRIFGNKNLSRQDRTMIYKVGILLICLIGVSLYILAVY